MQSEIVNKIKDKEYAFPFSVDFDKVRSILADFENKDEVDVICKFLDVCHELYLSIAHEILNQIEEFNFSQSDLLAYCFACFNRNFLDVSRKMFKSVMDMGMFEKEKVNFAKIDNFDGQEVGGKFALEVGVDILNELIGFIREQPEITNVITQKLSDSKENFKRFNIIFMCLNTLLNTRSNGYEVLVFEQGNITFRNSDTEIKIDSFFESINCLKTANDIRSSNHINEILLPITFSGRKSTKIKGIVNKKVAGYDEESGLLFLAPAGSLAMHLYGNPNIFVS